MAAKRYIPIDSAMQNPSFESLSQLQADIDEAFVGFGLPTKANDASLYPGAKYTLLESKIEIIETPNKYVVTVDVAGVSQDRVKLAVLNSRLIIKGEKDKSTEYQEKGFCLTENSYSSFERVLHLPDDIDKEHITAGFENNRLVIVLLRNSACNSSAQAVHIQRNKN